MKGGDRVHDLRRRGAGRARRSGSRGDLIVATNTDEESSGAGGLGLVLHGVKADAGIVTEPTGFDVWISCRGTSYAEVIVPGRPGHAEVFQPHWREGGAVNAIEKAQVVLDATPAAPRRVVEALRPDATRGSRARRPPDDDPRRRVGRHVSGLVHDHDRGALLSRSRPTTTAGAFEVEREVDEWIARAAAADPWLAENPPTVDVVAEPRHVARDLARRADRLGHGRGQRRRRPARAASRGLDSWYDGATFTRLGGTPSIAFGPEGFYPDGRSVAHTIDEYVPVDGLVDCAQGLAVAAMRFCRVARRDRSRASRRDRRAEGPGRSLRRGGGLSASRRASPSAGRSTRTRSTRCARRHARRASRS